MRIIALASLALTLSSSLALAQEAPPMPTDGSPTAGDSCSAGLNAGKAARAKGHLREARRQFKTCAILQCGSITHDECTKLAAEALEATPTVVIEAKDKSGSAVTSDLTVMIDDEVVAKELDGKSIAIDPGQHTVVVQRGSDRVSQTIATQEGIKARVVQLKFQTGFDPNGPVRDMSGHTIWPWALVAIGAAVGVAGMGVVVTSPDLPPGCNDDTKICDSLPGETSQALDARRDEAGRSVDQPRIGYAVVGVGVLLAAGGLLWHFFEPVEPRVPEGARAKMRIPLPFVMKNAAGLAASATF